MLVAYEYEGAPISDDHGGPVRLVVPRLYFWKSAKWLEGIEFVAEKRLGFWESGGTTNSATPGWSSATRSPRAALAPRKE